MRLSRGVWRLRVKDVHMVVGIVTIALNAVACVYGAWCWWRAHAGPWFWRVLRAAQASVVIQVALGGILVLTGRKPPGLHVLYGVLPLLVTLIAEQLRVTAAQMVLDARGLESSRAVGKLPAEEQRGIVAAIVQRELAVVTL